MQPIQGWIALPSRPGSCVVNSRYGIGQRLTGASFTYTSDMKRGLKVPSLTMLLGLPRATAPYRRAQFAETFTGTVYGLSHGSG